MNRSSFVIAKRAQDLSQNDMGSQRSLCSIIGRLYTRIDDKGEPVVKPVVERVNGGNSKSAVAS